MAVVATVTVALRRSVMRMSVKILASQENVASVQNAEPLIMQHCADVHPITQEIQKYCADKVTFIFLLILSKTNGYQTYLQVNL